MKQPFIKSEQHFINFLNKFAFQNKEKINTNYLLSIDFYIKTIYNKGFAEDYTWAVRNDYKYLYEKKLFSFIDKQNTITGESIKFFEEFSHYNKYNWTNDFLILLKTLKGKSGVYIFDSSRRKTLYVGQSINLQERIVSSFNERFDKYNKKVYLKCIVCKTPADSPIIEVYLIGKLKPVFNGTSKYMGTLSVKVNNIPDYTNRVLCIKIKRIK